MPDPRSADGTRERILAAAAAAFRENGVAPTALSEIARRVQISTPSIYHHFESKDALVEEVLSLGVRRAFERVKEAVAEAPEADPMARLRAAVEMHVAVVLETGDYSSANLRLYGQVAPDIRARLQRTQSAVGRYWQGLLRAAQDAGQIRADYDLSVLRMLILGSLNWTAEWYKPGRGLPPEEISRHAAALLLDGIRS